MVFTSDALELLVDQFSQLPGIGRKSAYRLAMHVLKMQRDDVSRFAGALIGVKDRTRYCSVCWNVTETDPCSICSNVRRSSELICVVEEPGDVFAVEKTHEFKGLYHVLGGALSPLNGVGPEELRVKELLIRIDEKVKEIILAINPNIEGEATIIYLSRLLKPLGVKVSRFARGLSVGSDLEFTDEATLVRALVGRVEV